MPLDLDALWEVWAVFPQPLIRRFLGGERRGDDRAGRQLTGFGIRGFVSFVRTVEPRIVHYHEAKRAAVAFPRWASPTRWPHSRCPPTGWGFRRFCRVSGAEHRQAQPAGPLSFGSTP